MKLLITDDSKMARKMTKKSVSEIFGDEIEIIEATNGQEAVEQYKEQNPEICLMDLTMPVKDGFEATKEIIDFDGSAKVIIVSADVQEGSMVKAKENGALGFIKKPINPNNLSKMFDKLGLKDA